MSRKFLIVGIILTLAILFGGVYFLYSVSEKQNRPLVGEDIPPTAPGIHVARGGSHEPYNSNPPTSGPHWGDGVGGAGIHDEEVPDELLVHSMEHGAVIVWYKADMNKEGVQKLKDVFAKANGKKILVPRKELDVPIAVTSWGRLLKLETIDEKQIIDMIEINSGHGPEVSPMY